VAPKVTGWWEVVHIPLLPEEGSHSEAAGVVGGCQPLPFIQRSCSLMGKRFFNPRDVIERRRELRSDSTPAEIALWRLLQRSGLRGRKFRRQHAIGPYIVDFYCPSERLVIELEGAAHDSDSAASRDLDRQRFLENSGHLVLRLENRNVFENPEGVLELISQQFGNR
jgi:very-short-patch-repair endonuclease